MSRQKRSGKMKEFSANVMNGAKNIAKAYFAPVLTGVTAASAAYMIAGGEKAGVIAAIPSFLVGAGVTKYSMNAFKRDADKYTQIKDYDNLAKTVIGDQFVLEPARDEAHTIIDEYRLAKKAHNDTIRNKYGVTFGSDDGEVYAGKFSAVLDQLLRKYENEFGDASNAEFSQLDQPVKDAFTYLSTGRDVDVAGLIYAFRHGLKLEGDNLIMKIRAENDEKSAVDEALTTLKKD